MVEFTFIIVTYNSHDLIGDCISSIFTYADADEKLFEVIVVDNSTVENHQLLKKVIKHNYKDKIRLIHNSQNGGYGQGNNVGIGNSTGMYICIMNPDVRFTEPLLLRTKKHFEDDRKLSLLSYKQTGGSNMSFFIKPEYKPMFGVGVLTKIINYLHLFSERKNYLSGAFFFARRKDMDAINLFDEQIFLYFEEPDISNRLLRLGKRIKFDPSKKYVHLNGGRDFNKFSFSNEMKSLNYYIRKFHLNRNKMARNYLAEYQFNLFLFNLTGKAGSAAKTRKEIEVIKEYFFSPARNNEVNN